MRWPAASVTTAFFQSDCLPIFLPTRRVLPCTVAVFTAMTSTLNDSATACAISCFVAAFATAKVYRPEFVPVIDFSVMIGRTRTRSGLMPWLPSSPRRRPRARRALAGAAGALLGPRLRAAARHARAVLRRRRAEARVRARGLERLEQDARPPLGLRKRLRKLDRAERIAVRRDHRSESGGRGRERLRLDLLARLTLDLGCARRRLRRGRAGDRTRD